MFVYYVGFIVFLALQLILVISILRLFTSFQDIYEIFESTLEFASRPTKKVASYLKPYLKPRYVFPGIFGIALIASAWCLAYATIFGIPMLLAHCAGRLARGEMSPLPTSEFARSTREHGFFAGMFSFEVGVIFLLWAFVIPGHIYADTYVQKGLKRPVFPYVINILVGVILCTEDNFVYRLLSAR